MLAGMEWFMDGGTEQNDLDAEAFALASKGQTGDLRALIQESESLHKRAVDPSALTNGFSMLHIAARKGHAEVVDFLVSLFPSSVEQPTLDGRRALHIAAHEGHKEIVEALYRAGADVEAVDSNGHTAFHFACWGGSLDAVKCFVEDLHADISVKTADGMTALQIAGAGDKLDIVQYLSAMPGQLAASDSVSGKNSLHTAASRGCFDTVKFLVESEQVDCLKADAHGNTALHLAAAAGHVGVLNYLLDETELAMDETNDFGQSPLHRACFGGHYDCCCALVDKGAYFGLTDSESRNALHHAAATGSHKICHFLCSVCKMSVFTEDNEGCTAIDYALNNGYRELASQLAKKGFVQLRCDKLVRGVQLFTPTFAQLSSSVGRS